MTFGATMVAQHVAFGVIAAIVVVGALRVVTTNNVVHAALWLVAVLTGVGASFLLLGAEFVGVTQIAHLCRRDRRAVPLRDHAHSRADRARGEPDGRDVADGPRGRRPDRGRARRTP